MGRAATAEPVSTESAATSVDAPDTLETTAKRVRISAVVSCATRLGN